MCIEMGILKYFENLYIVDLLKCLIHLEWSDISSMHLTDTSDCINFSPASASSHLHCSVAHTNIL